MAERPKGRGIAVRLTPMLVPAAGLVMVAAVVGLVMEPPARAIANQAAARPPVTTPADPVWIDIVRPFQMYDLAGGDYARLPSRYIAKRDGTGTARRDTLTYGPPQAGETFFRITLARRGSERPVATSLFVDVARSAAEAGLAVTKSGLPSTLPTRFGPFDVADVVLAGVGARSACLAFRAAGEAGPLAVNGIACHAGGTPSRAALACTIDRLDLVSAGDDEALQDLFAAAERRRVRDGRCAAVRLVDGDDPARLKGSTLAGGPD